MIPLGLVVVQQGGAWGFGEILIAIVIIAAVIGIVYAACNYFGIPIPGVVLKILGIVLIAALAIMAIRFLLSL